MQASGTQICAPLCICMHECKDANPLDVSFSSPVYNSETEFIVWFFSWLEQSTYMSKVLDSEVVEVCAIETEVFRNCLFCSSKDELHNMTSSSINSPGLDLKSNFWFGHFKARLWLVNNPNLNMEMLLVCLIVTLQRSQTTAYTWSINYNLCACWASRNWSKRSTWLQGSFLCFCFFELNKISQASFCFATSWRTIYE